MRISDRVSSLHESMTLALTAQAMIMQRRGIDIVSLTAGEPDFPTPDHVKRAAIAAIEENFTHYTANIGTPELREAAALKFQDDNNLRFTPDQIVVSSGAKACIFMALQALCDPDDEVLFQSPYYVSYPDMARLIGAKPVSITTTFESGYKLTPDQLRTAITPKTKVFIFNSPSNPTGMTYTREEIEAFGEVIQQKGIYAISDEIYEKILYDGADYFSLGAVDAIRDSVVTVNGASKAYAMTGWRIGYMGGNPAIMKAAAKVQGQITNNANSIAQKATVAALRGPQEIVGTMVQEFQRRRDFLVAELSAIPGLKILKPAGAFYLFPDVSAYYGRRLKGMTIRNSTDMCHYLLEHEKIALVPGVAFGNDKCVRLSYAVSMENLQKAVSRLRTGLAELE